MTIADDIEALVKRKYPRLKLTEQDIAEMRFGEDHAYQQRVNAACRQLVREGRLVRVKAGRGEPYTYQPPPITATRRR